MWDAEAYQRYRDDRARPFFDLTARVGAVEPRTVVDLGCGPGTLTATLAQRWPQARVVGLDSSPEMLEAAGRLETIATFELADINDWVPSSDVNVVVSN